MNTSYFRINIEDPLGQDSIMLIEKLTDELAQRYQQDGSGSFSPQDVMIPRAAFLVARLSGLPIGCGALRPMDDDTGEVKRMYVRPEFRGMGISRKILKEIETIARNFNYKFLRLETGILQTEAIGLYEASGYYRISCFGQYENNPQSICYEKKL